MATIDVAMENSVQAVKTVADNIYSKMSLESTSQSILSKLNADSAPAFRSPINSTSDTIYGGNAFSGTGKGKLWINFQSNSTAAKYKPTIVVDGVTIQTFHTTVLEIEFAQSFTVTSHESSSSIAAVVYCIAIFY